MHFTTFPTQQDILVTISLVYLHVNSPNDPPLNMGMMEVHLMCANRVGAFRDISEIWGTFDFRYIRLSCFRGKWRVAVLGKLLNSATARQEFSRHGGLSLDEV